VDDHAIRPRPRRRALKIAAWIAGGIVALVLVFSIAAALLIDPNAHKAELQAAFRDATGRDLTLQGPLSLKVFPWLAFQASDLAVANRDGFGEAPFASLGQARLSVRPELCLHRGAESAARDAVAAGEEGRSRHDEIGPP